MKRHCLTLHKLFFKWRKISVFATNNGYFATPLDLTYIPEAGPHDDGLVAVLLVVVEDLGHGLHAGVVAGTVGLA